MNLEQKSELVNSVLQKYNFPLYEPVIAIPSENPTEVIIELDPTSQASGL